MNHHSVKKDVSINLEKDALCLNEKRVAIELTKERLSEFNEKSTLFKYSSSVFSNTLFAKFCVNKYLIIDDIINDLNISDRYSINKLSLANLSLLSLLEKKSFIVKKNYVWLLLKISNSVLRLFEIIYFLIWIVITSGYLLTRKNDSHINVDDLETVEIINDKASLIRLKKYNNSQNLNPVLIVDDRNVDQKDLSGLSYISMYSLVSKKQVLKDFGYLLSSTISEYRSIRKVFNHLFIIPGLHEIMTYSMRRCLHTKYIQYSLEKWFHENHDKIKTVLSGVRDERFSNIQYNVAKKYNIHTICIPHGLAYNIRHPHGLFGDTYFAITQNEKEVLSNLFQKPNKFIFDNTVNEVIYNHHYLNEKTEIVYFTESRNIDLDRRIIKELLSNFPDLKVRLHPNDHKSSYPIIRDENFIEDFRAAISGNIVIARNSTILVEANYNNSVAMSILLNDKDIFYSDYMLPSLSDAYIRKFYSLDKLIQEINEEYKSLKT